MEEIFKPIKEYPVYEISNCGRVRSWHKGKPKILTPWLDSKKKYYMITLTIDNKQQKFLIHRLVAEYFVDNPQNKPVVNHIDHNTRNNYCDNLEWVTVQENVHHSYSVMSQVRNIRNCILETPEGEKLFFKTVTDMKKYQAQNNLPFSVHSINYYGKSKGYILHKL